MVLGLVLCGLWAGAANAAFPYGSPSGGGYALPDSEPRPNDLRGKLEWMYSATIGTDNAVYATDPRELNGVRGAHIVDKTAPPQTAWETTTGRPEVAIAVLDSGIKWNDLNAMEDLRRKTRLNRGELELPNDDRAGSPTEAGVTCADYDTTKFDANGDGVFNVTDYACDTRVSPSPAGGDGPTYPSSHPTMPSWPMLDPQDVLIAFSGEKDDDDGNGFEDDIVGWDFLDNDNDPFDDVQYGHGTGEARDSTAEAGNFQSLDDPGSDDPARKIELGSELGACPNCMAVHMRVGDSFVADVNRFAQATIYAVDNDVLVVQEALGTLNNSRLGTEAIEYAYDHGVTVIASAADEAAQHNNWPSSNPHVILVNSVTQGKMGAPSYLAFTGCTNFNSKITLAIPSVSCSSDATGRASGMAGLVHSAAIDAGREHSSCERVGGDPCQVSPNEVRQLMASGAVAGQGLSDDVNFTGLGQVEPSCTPVPANSCTDPFLSNPTTSGRAPGAPPGASKSYPARRGHDQFYGYGRVNMNRAVRALADGALPPEAEIDSPDWYAFVDPGQSSIDVRGRVAARGGAYRCRVLVAPGSYPNNSETTDAQPGDFKPVGGDRHCNGSDRDGAFNGLLASIDVNELRGRFPPNAAGFNGREPGTGTSQLASNGRPNIDPYGFVVKLEVTSEEDVGGTEKELMGEDRRNLRLHRDAEMMNGFPRDLGGDGASSPLFVDLDGDNRNELVIGGSDGFVHAFRPDGSELSGWPVRGDWPALHLDGRAFDSGEVSSDLGGAILSSVAAGDLDRDGAPEVVASDLEGKLYVWSAVGERVLTRESRIEFSGKPLAPFQEERKGRRNRTQHGFIASPVLADLDGNDGGKLEIVAAAMDRHLYAWNDDGSELPGYPKIVVDQDKVASIDPDSHAVSFNANAGPAIDQGAIIDTPAVGDLDGESGPEIVVGTNEEYVANQGNEGPMNASGINAFTLQIAPDLADLGPGNSRLYAFKADGSPLPGWPVKVGLLGTQVLPVVGEGITGSPVIGPVTCPNGGAGPKVGTIPGAGPGYIFNKDGDSCYGKGEGGKDVPLQSDGGSGAGKFDNPAIPAFGHPAFGNFGDPASGPSFLAPALGLNRALDIGLPEYQSGQDFIAAWNGSTGQFRPGFPAVVNDLQFLTGPSVGDLDGVAANGEEIASATASLDLQGLTAAGTPIDQGWPKLTSDWVVANPLLGSWGALETEPDTRKALFAVTRGGFMLAYKTKAKPCPAGSWPRFHHDNANSGDLRRDAVSSGRPYDHLVEGGTLFFKAPGDDLLCGKAEAYELVHSDSPISGRNFSGAEPLGSPPSPAEPGTRQAVALPAGTRRFVALRARDDQGNVGRPILIDRASLPNGGGVPGGGGPTGGGRQVPCSRPSGSLRGTRLGPLRLGQLRARVRRLPGARGLRRRMDRLCLTDRRSMRIGYGRSGRFRNRAVLLLTTSRRYRALGLRPGSRFKRPRGTACHRIGANRWYLVRRRGATIVLRVRRGRVAELGLADRRLTRTRSASRRFLKSF